jgi:hypothetical protein
VNVADGTPYQQVTRTDIAIGNYGIGSSS